MSATSSAMRRNGSATADLDALSDDVNVDVGVVAHILSCSPRHVWRLIDRGAMPAPLRIGRLCRFRLGTIRAWLRDGAKPVRPQ